MTVVEPTKHVVGVSLVIRQRLHFVRVVQADEDLGFIAAADFVCRKIQDLQKLGDFVTVAQRLGVEEEPGRCALERSERIEGATRLGLD